MCTSDSHVPAPPRTVVTPVPVSIASSSPPVIEPVQVPPGCYPIELVQFWRGHHAPLHWALFVRTTSRAPSSTPSSPTVKSKHRRRPISTAGIPSPPTPRGNFYELAGTSSTYTAQFLCGVPPPDMLPDWRGSHVVGWVRAGQLPMFERAVRGVEVGRYRVGWCSQHWVWKVMCVCASGDGEMGVDVRGVTFGGIQARMKRLLDAWENGDI